jgi:hypothetical protein
MRRAPAKSLIRLGFCAHAVHAQPAREGCPLLAAMHDVADLPEYVSYASNHANSARPRESGNPGRRAAHPANSIPESRLCGGVWFETNGIASRLKQQTHTGDN